MNIWRRLKNLWRLSLYQIDSRTQNGNTQFLVKTIPTIEKRLAKIIQEPVDYFSPEDGEATQ